MVGAREILFLLLLSIIRFQSSIAARPLRRAAPDDDDDDFSDASEYFDDEPEDEECKKDADCKGLQGQCKRGVCWYTANERSTADEDWPECMAGCGDFFGNFFQSPNAQGDGSCEGLLCNFWRNTLVDLTSAGSLGRNEAQDAEWKSLLQVLSGVAEAPTAVVPGLTPGSTRASMDCYCSRLCEMGSAAGLGDSSSFGWQSLSADVGEGEVMELKRLSMMEMVHAEYVGDACVGVHTLSLSAIAYVANAAGTIDVEESRSIESFVQVGHVKSNRTSSSPASLQQLELSFNPMDCLKKLSFWARTDPQGEKMSSGVLFGATKAIATKASWAKSFLTRAAKGTRYVADAVKDLPLVGNSVSKAMLYMKGKNFGNTFSAAQIVVHISIGDVKGATNQMANLGITKLAGGSVAAAFGFTGGAALAVSVMSGIGVSMVVSTGFSLLGGASATTAAAAGAGTGIVDVLKQSCK